MGVGVGTILRRYVTHALMNPSAVYLADFPGLRFRPILQGQGIVRPEPGSFVFDDSEPRTVGGFGSSGNGRPVFTQATGAVGVIVPKTQGVESRDLADRYAEATRRALHTGPWSSFADAGGATLALNMFDFYVDGRLQPSRIITRNDSPNGEPYYLVVTRYRGTAQPTD